MKKWLKNWKTTTAGLASIGLVLVPALTGPNKTAAVIAAVSEPNKAAALVAGVGLILGKDASNKDDDAPPPPVPAAVVAVAR